MWMTPATQQSDTQKALNALNADKSGANTARIDYILSGSALTHQFGDPTNDPRTPDLIVQPIPGTIYSTSKAKVAEHGEVWGWPRFMGYLEHPDGYKRQAGGESRRSLRR